MIDDRVSAKELERIQQRLSERDLAILRAVSDHQFMTTRQIQRLLFHAHQNEPAGIRATLRVLSRLIDHRVLTCLERPIGGTRAGSSAYVWCLDVVGDRLARAESGGSRRRFYQPSLTFLGHKLAVAESRVVVEETVRTHGMELLSLEIEMQSWRPFLGAGGQTIKLKPDLSLVTASAEFEDSWLIEVDLGSESFRTLIEKCFLYDAYRRTGREQAAHGVFPRVLWIMPTSSRADQLRNHIAHTKTLDTRLFTIITPDQLPSVIAEAVA